MSNNRKVARGDPPRRPTATLYNELMAAAQAGTQLTYGQSQPSQAPQSMYQPRAWTARIKNTTATALTSSQILGISDAPLIPGETNRWEFVKNWALTGVAPDSSLHENNFAVLISPATNNRITQAVVAGPVAVQVDINNASDKFATVETNNHSNLVSGSSGARIVTKPSGTGIKWCVVDLGSNAGGGESSFATFTTSETFTTSDPSVLATKGAVSWPSSTPAMGEVYNTCGVFFGPESDLCGLAVWNSVDNRWQIVQLECAPPAQQESNFQSSLGDSISYAGTATPIPFGRQTDASQGDLVTLEADGSLTFNRPTRNGIVDITFSAVIDDILGIGNDGEKSIFQIEYDNLGGGGYAPIEVAVAVGHPTFRIPPNDYGLGGTTFGHWTFSTSATTGHKLRMVASTANGNTVSTEFLQSLFKVTEV